MINILLLAKCAILIIIGFILLVKSSDAFISGSVNVGRFFKISELVIGLTVIAIGTSMPEVGASVVAAYLGSGGIAIGNILGSNIANICLILGVCMCIKRFKFEKSLFLKDTLIMLALSSIFALFIKSGLSRIEGFILLFLFAVYIFLLFNEEKRKIEGKQIKLTDKLLRQKVNILIDFLKLCIGLSGVLLGGKILVDNAINLAKLLGVSEGVIGTTLVAVGTSVPEFAVSINAIRREYIGISVGNIIGSNIFNILWIGGLSAVVATKPPLQADSALFYFSVPMMFISIIFFLIFINFSKERITHWQGIAFLLLYFLFVVLNYIY